MLRRFSPVVLGLVLIGAGCSLLGGGLAPGDVAEGDLDNGIEIGEIIPDAEEVLLSVGIAVEDDWPAVEFDLAGSEEGISLFVEEDDIDPVIVVIDSELNILVAGDDWDEELDAFVSLDEVPQGARAVVFDISGDDGVFTIEADEADDYLWELEIGETFEGAVVEDKENELWEDLITDVYDIYREDWETCTVIPMTITDDLWLRVAVSSDVDCVMAVLEVDDDDLDYVDYDDDTDDMNPVFSGELDAGTYLFIVDSYAGSQDAEFTIEVTEIDPDEMMADIVTVYEIGEWYSGEFMEGSMVLSYWPEAGDYWGIYPDEQVVVFEFQIDEDAEYVIEASCYDDTKMAVIDQDMYMIDYNDDGPDGALDPQLTLQLAPGQYSALVTPYSDGTTEWVDFRVTMTAPVVRDRGYAPMDDTFYTDSNVYLSLVFEPGETWEIYAESQTDLTLTVVDATGEVYFSDDDGGDFNPWLEIEATEANAGAWDIDVEGYGGSGINDEIHFVARPVEERTSAEMSAPVQIDL